MQISHSFKIEIITVKKLDYKVPYYGAPDGLEGYEVFGTISTESKYPYPNGRSLSKDGMRERLWHIDAIMVSIPQFGSHENGFVRVGLMGANNGLVEDIAANYLKTINLDNCLIAKCGCDLNQIMITGCSCGGE